MRSQREILSKFKTRHRQYFYIADSKYPGKMVAATPSPEGDSHIVVGIFPKMKTRQQFQWLSGRLDRLIDIFADFQALNDYEILLAETPSLLDPSGLDLTPGVRPGWEAEEEEEAAKNKKAKAVEDDAPDLTLPMRLSKVRKPAAQQTSRRPLLRASGKKAGKMFR